MKKILVAIIALFALCSCTEQIRIRSFGGRMEIDIPRGYKVTSATWKDSDLFYFLEPMEAEYVPKEKKSLKTQVMECWKHM